MPENHSERVLSCSLEEAFFPSVKKNRFYCGTFKMENQYSKKIKINLLFVTMIISSSLLKQLHSLSVKQKSINLVIKGHEVLEDFDLWSQLIAASSGFFGKMLSPTLLIGAAVWGQNAQGSGEQNTHLCRFGC